MRVVQGINMSEKNNAQWPTIFITGAGRRLGLYLVEHYLAAGWRVIAHYHSANELSDRKQKQYGEKDLYCALQANLANVESVERLTGDVIDLLNNLNVKLDGLIHNASCFYPDDLAATAEQQWQNTQTMTAVHLMAPQLISLKLAELMVQNSSMIAISDIYADLPNERFASYCAAKAGLQNLALSLAQRLAPHVRVNVIQPGPVKFLPEHSAQYRQKVLSQSLIKKELGYQAIQQGIDYLLAAQAVTGTILRIDGGRSCANRYEQTFID
jgi:dihydromonapterin reductase/dihydrofolate reductase